MFLLLECVFLPVGEEGDEEVGEPDADVVDRVRVCCGLEDARMEGVNI